MLAVESTDVYKCVESKQKVVRKRNPQVKYKHLKKSYSIEVFVLGHLPLLQFS